MKIILKGNPVSTNVVYRRHGNYIYMSNEGRKLKASYSKQVGEQWKEALIKDNILVSISLYFKDKRRRDIDNWHKILLDSLTKIVWNDDSQITQMKVVKQIDKYNPRIEIEITKL